MKLEKKQIEKLMDEALRLAMIASDTGEVPVGAVIWRNGEIIAQAHNQTEKLRDPTAHAECLAVRRAAEKLQNWRLDDCALCVTLEPCTMCLGAIQLARIPLLIFGAFDKRLGAVGSLFDLTTARNDLNMRVISGIQEKGCADLLSGFFQTRR